MPTKNNLIEPKLLGVYSYNFYFDISIPIQALSSGKRDYVGLASEIFTCMHAPWFVVLKDPLMKCPLKLLKAVHDTKAP